MFFFRFLQGRETDVTSHGCRPLLSAAPTYGQQQIYVDPTAPSCCLREQRYLFFLEIYKKWRKVTIELGN
jgi:hypothetical protein